MTFLDKVVCCSTTAGDLFKLILPVGWAVISLCAVIAYLSAPLSRGDSPRWGSAALVCVAALSGIGLTAGTYSFHRSTSKCSIDWDEGQRASRRRRLRVHALLSATFLLLTFILLIFFATVASGLGRCAHETCGADIGWSAIALGVSLLWLGVTILGMKELSRARPVESLGDRFAGNREMGIDQI